MNYELGINNKNKGAVSVIMSVMILNILFVVGSGISFLIFQQAKLSNQTGESVVAFYAADSGAEQCLYQIRKKTGAGCDTPGGGTVVGPSEPPTIQMSYVVEYNGTDTIISKGNFKSTNRALQLSF